jgi:YfiH family protein
MEVDVDAGRDGVLVAFTGRRGGVSRPPYDTLNLAARVGDDGEAVEENRRRVAAALGYEPQALALARQVHGADVLAVGERTGLVGTGDGLITDAAHAVLGLLTADCAPVVLLGRRLAVAHAGWRGLTAGIIAKAVAAAAPVRAAWVGPSIRSCCYEVGPEVVDAFAAAGLPVAGDRHVDIADAAGAAAGTAGAEAVVVSRTCTSCDPGWFSYRRDGTTGRNGTFAALLRD